MKKAIFLSLVAITSFSPGIAQLDRQAKWANTGNKDFTLTLHYHDISFKDTFQLVYSCKLLRQDLILENDENLNVRTLTTTASKQGSIIFHLKNIQPGYISIFKSATSLFLDAYFIEPGDKIDLKIDTGGMSMSNTNFSGVVYTRDINSLRYKYYGHGQTKYNLRFNIDQNYSAESLFNIINSSNPLDTINYIAKLNHGLNTSIAKINSQRAQLSRLAYEILITDITSYYYSHILMELRLNVAAYGKDTALIERYCNAFYRYLSTLKESNYPPSVQLLSKGYRYYLLQKTIAKYQLQHIYDFRMDGVYKQIKSEYNSSIELRDYLLAMLFLNYGRSFIHSDSLLNDAITIVHSKNPLNIFKQMHEAFGKGKTAYNFSLPDAQGNIVRLKDFKGKTVFIDFWYTGCGACREYYQNVLSKVEDTLKDNKNFVFITISIDRKKETWLKSVESGQYTSDQIINLYTAGKADDHDVIKHYLIKAYPHPMIIDRSGKMYQFQGRNLRVKKELFETLNQAL